ncbi:NADP-dependent oxidoreductase [Umezawaea beigongshangensis]|uniref:NADP-dependent oxidoreductase n=1 Tax=Umezawaea beigongshangensis TaxID=2780383 RepID=UPI0018F18EF0|nr:NADP-dependent oxidoreductase [Umezawaea beigongshangensis]
MTVPSSALEVRLASRPQGWPTEENFEVVEVPVPRPGDGQIVVRNLVMSVDPYMRGRMNDTKSYVPPFELGVALEGGAVGEVVISNAEGFEVGDTVLHGLGWREYGVLDAARAVKVDPDAAPLTAYLGALGMTGLTAYAGLLEVGEFREGDVVFVSGAAGAVGAVVGQIARLRGASKVIGSAGSAEKVAHLVDDLGFDAAFDYKDGPVREQLAAAAPDGIDLYFDNVGGEHLEAAIDLMNNDGRVVLCGAISQYNEQGRPTGVRNLALAIGKRLRLHGMIASDHIALRPRFLQEVGGWLASGELKHTETVVDGGVREAPRAFLDMMRGANRGKMLVRLS